MAKKHLHAASAKANSIDKPNLKITLANHLKRYNAPSKHALKCSNQSTQEIITFVKNIKTNQIEDSRKKESS